MGPSEPTSRHDPDRDLLERWRRAHREEEEVCRQIFDRHWRTVAAAFHRGGHSSEVVKELTQETFLRVFKSLEAFRGDTLGKGWILRIAASVHVSEIRRLNAIKRGVKEISWDALLAPPDPADPAASPETRMLARERSGLAGAALERLSDKRRICLVLRTVHELGEEEIAWLLQIAPATVRVHISQARKQLRETLARRFPEPRTVTDDR